MAGAPAEHEIRAIHEKEVYLVGFLSAREERPARWGRQASAFAARTDWHPAEREES